MLPSSHMWYYFPEIDRITSVLPLRHHIRHSNNRLAIRVPKELDHTEILTYCRLQYSLRKD